MPREITLARVRHPDPLRVLGSHDRVLLNDDVTRRLQTGDPTLGWEGDPRLGLYINIPERRFELWRLEYDATHRMVMSRPCDLYRVADLVPRLVLELIAHDTRRGFDVVAHVNTANENRDIALDKAAEPHTEEFADRLKHALIKDGVD